MVFVVVVREDDDRQRRRVQIARCERRVPEDLYGIHHCHTGGEEEEKKRGVPVTTLQEHRLGLDTKTSRAAGNHPSNAEPDSLGLETPVVEA